MHVSLFKFIKTEHLYVNSNYLSFQIMHFFIHQKISFPVPVSQDMTSQHIKVCRFMLHLEVWAHKTWEPTNKWCSVSPKIVFFTSFITFLFQLLICCFFLHLSVLLQRKKGSSSGFEACKSTEQIAWTNVILRTSQLLICSRKHRPFI
jgi:hypothetical protein